MYYLELLMPESEITKDKKWWKCTSYRNYWSTISPLQYCQQWLSVRFKTLVNIYSKYITEVVLVHSNIVNNDYQQDSRLLSAFVPDKSFCQLLDISPKNVIFLKTVDPEF